MALQAVCEVALHFGTFRNVDLFYQGVYHLRCRLFEESDEGSTANAVPNASLPEYPTREEDAEEVVLLPAAILEDEAVFRTKSFIVEYCEEIVEINDVVLFRLERPAGKETSVKVEVQLMFAEAPAPNRLASLKVDASGYLADLSARSVLSTPGRGAVNPPGGHVTPNRPGFISVASQQLRLHDVMQGMHAFCPLSFDEMHFCRVELMAHSTLLDFRLRIRQEASPPAAAMQRRERGGPTGLADALLETARKLSAAGAEATGEPLATSGSGEVTAGLADSGDTAAAVGANGPSLAEAIDHIQRRFVDRLLASHAELAAFLVDIAAGQLPPVKLPGNKEASQPGSLVPVSARLANSHGPAAAVVAARLLAEDLSFVSAQVLQGWQWLLKVCMQCLEDVTVLLEGVWMDNLARYWGAGIFCRTVQPDALVFEQDEDLTSNRMKLAADLRQSKAFRNLRSHTIEDLLGVPPPQEQPIIFEHRYGHKKDADSNPSHTYVRGDLPSPRRYVDGPEPCNGAHVIVLVHGFQGTGFDMRLLRDNILMLYPSALCLCSAANEDDTEGNIEQMGERLAAEVRNYIQDWCQDESSLETALARLSFITHSAGGLITRAALPLLAEFHGRMHTFLSFSSPHLGYLYSSNTLFKAGLWVVKKIKKSKCLEQLSMTDTPDPGSCFLSRLSELPGLEHFRHVVLASSHQDQYAPFESARIEMPRVAEADSKLGPCYAKMLRSILGPLKAERVIRLDVNFHIPETNIDAVIGRTAHIQFLDSQPLMKMLVHTHGFLFE